MCGCMNAFYLLDRQGNYTVFICFWVVLHLLIVKIDRILVQIKRD